MSKSDPLRDEGRDVAMSDTPRTDALMNDKDAFVLNGPMIIIQLCHALERENAELRRDAE